MKSRGSRWRAGIALFLVLVLAMVIAACGGGGSSSSSTEATETTETPATTTTTEESESKEVAEGGSTEAWTLPNVDVQNTRAIESGITPENVASLKPAWTVELNGAGTFGTFASNPVFSPDGKSVYLQDLSNDVFAVNVESGEIEWEYDVPASASNQEGPNGVAYYEGDLYGETNTAAFALSAETGEKVWEMPNLAEKKGQGFNIQPQPYEGKIFLSTSGQLKGGVAYALDAKTGKVLWEFEETKEQKDKEAGGELGTGGAWNAPAIGPEGEVFYGIANPYRSIETAIKEPTKLLYNDSTVSLDQETGKLNWYFQGVENDFHDWDMQVSPIYTEEGGEPLIIDAGKMGYVYAMDPKTGKLMWKTQVGKHNGHDNDDKLAMEGKYKKPKLPYNFYPGILGGVETNMAVGEGMVYVAINDTVSTFKKYNEPIASPANKGTGEMEAVSLETGKVVWDTKLPTQAFGDATFSNGLVFTTEFAGNVLAFDAKTGKQVMKAKLPAGANSPVAINGEYLITAAGFPTGAGQKAQVVAFKVGATGSPVESVLAAGGTEEKGEDKSGEGGEKEETTEAGGGASSELAAGEETFDTNCSSCHTLAAAGTNGNVGPNLDELKPSDSLVEKQVTNGGGGMPAFGSSLSKEEIKNVATFVSTWAGKKLTPAQEKLAEENGSAGGP
jgi:outer membrane protein assembly factor BamB